MLNLGCRSTPWGEIRVDIDAAWQPTFLADCRRLPFRDAVFDTVLFANVIEHLDRQGESAALGEIARTLRPRGRLLLTATNQRRLMLALDPERWLLGYRFFKRAYLLDLLEDAGFEPESVQTIGDPVREAIARMALYAQFPYKLVVGSYVSVSGKSSPDPLRGDDSGFYHFIVAAKRG